MVLQAQLYPSAGPQQGYVHKEEYYHKDNYNNGAAIHKEEYYHKDNYNNGAAIHKEDYYSKDGYYGNNPSNYVRPTPGIHSSHGSNHPTSGYGGYHTPGDHHSHGHGNYPQHGSVNHGYGNHHGSHIPVGPNQHHHHGSSGPYYGQNKNQSWISKDLDD